MITIPESWTALLDTVQSKLTEDSPLCIAIDGPCASGKSTLAAWLKRELDAEIVHMDDFFLPAQLRTKERLSLPGGNIHYERFNEEVVPGIRTKRPFCYRAFSCETMLLQKQCEIKQKPLWIVEGSYSLRPEWQPLYDIKICMGISREEQLRRLAARNAGRFNDFVDRWIPMEEQYFAFYQIAKHCDIFLPE